MGYTHGTLWTDKLIKEKVQEVISALSLERMPSRAEIEEYFQDSSLTNAIARRDGFYNLAAELNLEVKESETRFGKGFEDKAEEILLGNGFNVRRMSTKHPYDILVDDCVKIDVKASRLYEGKNGNFYSFNTEKPFATCDFYLLFTVKDDGNYQKCLVVPSNMVIANTQISLGQHNSKYYRFEDRFDLIERAVDFWEGVC